ncbi:MAG: hypothetical protein Q4615_03390 [Paracoccus aminovorans]|nr:hypothetical protein [Paracoccus aminovorans]
MAVAHSFATPALPDSARFSQGIPGAILPNAPQSIGQSAIISGTLKDADGQPVAGYPIILENQISEERGYSGNVGFTSETGDFSVAVEQPGYYTTILPTAPGATTSFEVSPDVFNSTGGRWDSRQNIGVILLPSK